MRNLAFILVLFGVSIVTDAQIIADHSVVDQFDEIPQQYIDSVKSMLVSITGESHASGYRNGLNLLELLDDTYQVSTFSNSSAPAVTDQRLRLGSYFWMGENYFFSQGKVEELKDWLTEENTSGNPIDVMGFGWCWDMTWHNAPGGTEDSVYRVHWAGSSVDGADGDRRWGLDSGDSLLTGNRVNMSTYLASVEQYMKHCADNGYPTQWIFTTGPVDGNEGTETGMQREIKQNYIRDYAAADKSRVLFDFADILCWSDSGEHYMADWNDEGEIRPHAQLHPDNMMDYDASWNRVSHHEDGDHIGEVGALRLGKAMWWMLARMQGWRAYVPVTGIQLSSESGSSLITTTGGKLQLQALLTPLDATDTTLSWSVISGSGSASIDSTGLLTALSNGSVTAMAMANDSSGVYGEIHITINDQLNPVREISVIGTDSSTQISTDKGSLRLRAVITPLDATDTTVCWSLLQGTGSASIDSSGLVRALSNGSVTARATANDSSRVYGELQLTISNQITLVDEISVFGADSSTMISRDEGTLRLRAVITPLDATDTTVLWSVIQGTGSASIDSSGLVRALSNGSVTARATANDTSGIYGELLLTISNQIVLIDEISVFGADSSTQISIDEGTLSLHAMVTPLDATDTTVLWSVIQGTGSASIDSSGLVRALSNGSVTARATANDTSGIYGELLLTISNQIVLVDEISVFGTDSSTMISTDKGTLRLKAVITPLDATDTTVLWSVIQGTGSASIDSSGLVRALSNGSVTARATANDSSGIYGELLLTIGNQIVLVDEISVFGTDSSTQISRDKGTLSLRAVITPIDATDTTVLWSVIQGTGSASIDSSGLVRALSNGSVTARATANDTSGIYGELLLTISNQIVLVDEISVFGADSSTVISRDKGTLRLRAVITPIDATDTTVLWSVIQGTGSASIDSSGLVRALSNGSVTARATANDTSGIYGELLLSISNQIILVNEIEISVEGASPLIEEVGGKLQLQALIAPSDATDTTITWWVNNGTGTASIDSVGLLTALSDGSVSVRAVANDTSGVFGELDILIGARDTLDLWINPVDPIEVFSGTSTYAGRRAMPVSMPTEGDIQSITIYHEGGVGGLILGLYADASGLPGTRLGTSAITAINSTAAWQTIDLLNPVTVGAGETVWLAWVFESNPGIRYESGSPGRAQTSESWDGGMPTDFGSSDQSDYRYSIYCTYTAIHQPELPPASPSDLSAVNITAHSVTLVWTDNSEDETGFELERSVLPGSGFVTILTTAADITSYLDESVEPEQSYYYRLRSVNSHGESDYSPEISVITLAETPGVGTIGFEEVYNQTSVYANRRAMPVTLVENVDIQSISIYHQGGSGGLILGVYENDSGSPGTRLGLTSTATLSSSQGWQTLSLISPLSVGAGETIWLAWVFESNPGIRYESGSPGRAQASTTWSSGMPSDFGSSGQSDYRYSIYCTFTPTGYVGTVPAAPSDLSASDTTAHSVTLVWTDNSDDETGFELERSDLPGSGFVSMITTAADMNIYLDESVEAEHTYYYRLRSVNSYGESDYSPEISVLTPAEPVVVTAPAAPSDLSASHTTAHSVTLVWTDNSDDETGFELERSDLPGSGFVSMITTAADMNIYLDESVEAEHTYYYRLRSVNSYGESDYSPEITVLTPAEPSGGGSIGFEEVYDQISIYAGRRAMPVTLVENVEIQNISIYHDGGSGGLILGVYEDNSGSPGTRLGITQTAMLNESAGWQTVNLLSSANVQAGETVWLAWVFESNPGIHYESGSPGRAQSSETWGGSMPSEFGSSGQSDYRYSIYCTYVSSAYVGAAPAAPSDLSVSNLTANSISLFWTDNSFDETGFELERSDMPGSGFETIQNPAAGVTGYMDESVEPEHTYYYRIRSVNSYGNSNYSPEISVLTPAEPIEGNTFGFEEVYDRISVYANRRAMPVTMPENGYIQSVTIYHQGGNGDLILGVYEDNSGSPGSRLGITGTTMLNATADWQTVNLLSPVNTQAGETVWLAWVFESNPGIRYESGSPGRAQSSETWGGGLPSDFGSSGRSDYRYSIYASYTTSIAPVLKNMTVGMEELNSIQEKVIIYPNPTSGELTLTWKCTYSDGLLLSVYNSVGRLMKNMDIAPGLQSVQINIGDFHKGLYLVVLTDARKKQVVNQSRVIKIH